MQRSSRRLLAILAGRVAFTVGSALLYQLGMEHLEGAHRSFWRSFEWAAETLSTTGYGADTTWNHPLMVLFVVSVQFVGVFLFFLVVPIFLLPFPEQRFAHKLRRSPAYTVRHIIRAALAAHASEKISPRLPGIEAIEGLQRCELRIPPSSPFAGKTLGDASLGACGAVVVGKWTRNRLEARCAAD